MATKNIHLIQPHPTPSGSTASSERLPPQTPLEPPHTSSPLLSTSTSDTPELDVLFQATRQVETAFLRERNLNHRIKNEFAHLSSRYYQENSVYQKNIQSLSAHYDEAKQQVLQLRGQVENLKQQLEAHRRDAHSKKKMDDDEVIRAMNEKKMAQATAEHLRRAVQVAEKDLFDSQQELKRLKLHVEKIQNRYLETEHQKQELSHEQGLLKTQSQKELHSLKETLRQTQYELEKYKSRWIDAERMKQESLLIQDQHADLKVHFEEERKSREQLHARLKKLEEKNRFLQAELQLAQKRSHEAEALLQSTPVSAGVDLRARNNSTDAPSLDLGSDFTDEEWSRLEQSAITGFPISEGNA